MTEQDVGTELQEITTTKIKCLTDDTVIFEIAEKIYFTMFEGEPIIFNNRELDLIPNGLLIWEIGSVTKKTVVIRKSVPLFTKGN